MKKAFIFGTGSTGRRISREVKEKYQIIGFLDNDSSKWGGNIDGVPIVRTPEGIFDDEYDEIIICSLQGMQSIKKQLITAGVSQYKINTDYISTQVNARINYLRDFADLYRECSKEYAVAEGGVFQGDFAKEINLCFPNSTLYLFDTFEGFDNRDINIEHREGYSVFEEKHMGKTSAELVLSKLPYKEKAIIRKGYFPETTVGLSGVRFFFVNLDFDLYNPTLDGLRFFYPRLGEDGVILVHDYYNPGYLGIKKAIDDFEMEIKNKLVRLPIGDHCSIALLKDKYIDK